MLQFCIYQHKISIFFCYDDNTKYNLFNWINPGGEKMANIKRVILHVDGMTCSSCELRIEKAINKLEGVKEGKAVYSSSKVYVTFNQRRV